MAKYEEWLTEEGLIRIKGWARNGLSDKDISQQCGVAESTFNEWKKKFPELSESLKEGKEVPDRKVENALYQSAVGYHYTEEQVTNTGEVVEVKRYSKPNITAQIFWLKNRKPNQWRDKTEQDLNVQGTVVFEDDID